jgi:hypothetical protein
MTRLVWDDVGDKVYETGVDQGVLYLPDGSAVPWNGLTSVIESFGRESAPVYFDGMKISDSVTLGEFSATLSAITYPDEFLELEGLASMRNGVFVGDQKPKSFGLCYRSLIGDDIQGTGLGYKLHILYNVTAIPNDKPYSSISDSPSAIEFEWSITAVPEETPGFRPTAHFVIDSRDIDPWLLEDLEVLLYGSSTEDAVLLPMSELVSFMNEWYRLQIVDNGDGTWTATSQREGFISYPDEPDIFQIINANVTYLDADTYVISDTRDISDIT